MILCRSALMLHLQTPSIGYQVLFQFKHAYSSFLCNSTSHGIHFFSLTRLRQRQSRTFGTAVAAVTETKGRDTFFAEENISWNSLGLSDTISQALSNIGLERPSLVQVPFFLIICFCNTHYVNSCPHCACQEMELKFCVMIIFMFIIWTKCTQIAS